MSENYYGELPDLVEDAEDTAVEIEEQGGVLVEIGLAEQALDHLLLNVLGLQAGSRYHMASV